MKDNPVAKPTKRFLVEQKCLFLIEDADTAAEAEKQVLSGEAEAQERMISTKPVRITSQQPTQKSGASTPGTRFPVRRPAPRTHENNGGSRTQLVP